MECPQCEDPLVRYALGGREAVICERCGYVGIEADHHGRPRAVESWDDALRRFYGDDGDAVDPTVPVRPDASGDSAESDRAERDVGTNDSADGESAADEDAARTNGERTDEAAQSSAGDSAS